MADQRKQLEAAALTYQADAGMAAPVVTALGRGFLAEKIIEKAREHNVPIVSDSLLAHTLNQLEIGEEIPKEFYAVVAQILVAVSKMDRDYSRRKKLIR